MGQVVILLSQRQPWPEFEFLPHDHLASCLQPVQQLAHNLLIGDDNLCVHCDQVTS